MVPQGSGIEGVCGHNHHGHQPNPRAFEAWPPPSGTKRIAEPILYYRSSFPSSPFLAPNPFPHLLMSPFDNSVYPRTLTWPDDLPSPASSSSSSLASSPRRRRPRQSQRPGPSLRPGEGAEEGDRGSPQRMEGSSVSGPIQVLSIFAPNYV